MEEKFTKSYGIKRIAELTEEITRLNKQIKFLENEYKIRINSYKEYYEKLLADLEAKLAESEKENRDLEDDHNKLIEKYNEQYNDLCQEIRVHSSARERFVKKVKELEQQLAEKDKEIEEFRFKERNIFPMVENLEKKVNQDKITFCVEQINKTVKLAKEILGYEKVIDYFYRQRFEEEVEEQIKKLKEK